LHFRLALSFLTETTPCLHCRPSFHTHLLLALQEITMADKLIIFDTTLRDGEQSPGASMTREEKLRIARQLERLKVDVIEAGFAASSNGDFEAVKSIADAIKDCTVCSLARANDRDIARAAEALKGAQSARIHTFIATSALHMEKKLRMTPEQVLEQARLSVRFARNLCDNIEFSPEDGYRSDPEFLARVVEAVIAEGATTVNIPDTVGYAIPELYGQFIRTLRERVPNSDKAIWSVHCHNDLGMAVANSLAGVKIGGARQVECTINGLGERAGNCALEEVVMAVRTRRDYFGLELSIDATQIVPASRMVAQTTGFVVQPNKAVVGANAFAHASGIHQDGVLKARDTYEIMRAEDVGWAANKIVLGKLSGRNAFKQRLQELGIDLASEAEVNAAFARFKDLADRKSEIFDEDILALVSDESVTPEAEHYRLLALAQRSEMGERPQAEVSFAAGAQEFKASSEGNGPVDASIKAIESRVHSGAELLLYSVNAITSGSTESQGEVTVRLQLAGRIVNGVGADPDIVVASAKAYLAALNKLHSKSERVAAQG
jgi:2-isopropylmalate synthase